MENVVQPDRRMRITCRITEDTDTHSEYARTRLNVAFYVHCLSRYRISLLQFVSNLKLAMS